MTSVTQYIFLLSPKRQKAILKDVKASLIKLGYEGEELEEQIKIATGGRICDINGLIDIEKYLPKKSFRPF